MGDRWMEGRTGTDNKKRHTRKDGRWAGDNGKWRRVTLRHMLIDAHSYADDLASRGEIGLDARARLNTANTVSYESQPEG